MSIAGMAEAAEVARFIRGRLDPGTPVTAIVLGSGLSGVSDRMGNSQSIAYADIPGFFTPGVEGHAGHLIVGDLADRRVIVLAGRFHMYEGHSARVSAFPMRVMHALGVRTVFSTNAAGALNPALSPGDLVLVEDQINLTWQNPLWGAREPGDQRFPDMSAPYSPRLRALVREAASAAGVQLAAGVYVGLLGPTYETPAEVRMLARLSADVTGMSTVSEAIVAAALGMEFVAVSLVTNAAAGLTDAPVRHADVVDAANKAGDNVRKLLEEFVRRV